MASWPWPLKSARFSYFQFGIVLIVLADALVELAGDAADGRLVADVGGAQAAGGQAAEVLARLDQHDALAHAGRLNRRGDAAEVPP